MTEPLKAEMPILMEILGGAERAAVVLGAAQLDLFSPLGNGPAKATEVAAQTGLPLRGVERVLNACVALGFVVKENDLYRNSPLADTFLVKGKPGYIGNMIKQTNDRFLAWTKMPEAIRTDKPVLPLTGAELFNASAEVLDNYVHGLFDLGKGLAARIASLVDLSACHTLLDVAGGSGVYSIILCRQFPQLQSVVFDLPPILERTRKIIEREGMTDRVSVREGNYFKDNFGSGLDVILLSNMLQTEGRQTCRMVLQKAFAALNPGGQILVHGIMPDADRTGPLQQTIFSVFMMLVFPEGEAYSGEEIIDWLHESGFVEGKKMLLPPPAFSSLVVARKPG
ncbi:MAG: class I SAM-dependent methyltransferase [Deltaproteobacteria bacterium]|nr:class I SAM-dependent methyltransferase [Deltaproteobacteria bacterium]